MASTTSFAIARRVEDLDVTINTDTLVNWQEVVGDSLGYFDLTTDPAIVKIPITGVYFVMSSGKWLNLTNSRTMTILRNDAVLVEIINLPNADARQQRYYLGRLEAGDVLHVEVRAAATTTFLKGDDNEDYVYFGIFFLGPV